MKQRRPFIERVDLGILAAAHRLSELREQTIRASIRDFRASSVENAALSQGTEDEEIWRLRIRRCDELVIHEDDWLRKTAVEAVDWWERGE